MTAASTITRKKGNVILLVPLILSAFTHMWNPVGFPDIFYDEGVYMRRAMHVMEGLGPQEETFYDHPYFGQIFLAGAFWLVGYPSSLQLGTDSASMAALYFVPRILMGLLAVVDTLLVFKIAEHRYGSRVATIAAILFAVMPITWIMRRILLDSILLPFLLTSILSAMHAGSSEGKKKTVLVLLAGIFLGAAIFTKVPIVTMIPLVGYLVYSGMTNNKQKMIALWFIPVFLIPLIWPIYSIESGQFEFWIRDVIWQSQRQGIGFSAIVAAFSYFDPVLFILSIAGIAYAIVRRQVFILLWIVPFVALLSLIGYVQYFHWIPVLPVFCIAAARLIDKIAIIKSVLPYAAITGLGAFGLASTTLLITADVTSAQFEAAYFVANYTDNDITIAANPVYSWIFLYILDKEQSLTDYRDLLFQTVETKKLLLISDNNFQANTKADNQLQDAYDNTSAIIMFEGNVREYDRYRYPYASMIVNYEGDRVEIRVGNQY